jgi:hypothetical protein
MVGSRISRGSAVRRAKLPERDAGSTYRAILKGRGKLDCVRVAFRMVDKMQLDQESSYFDLHRLQQKKLFAFSAINAKRLQSLPDLVPKRGPNLRPRITNQLLYRLSYFGSE